MENISRPILQALVIADHVYQDVTSGKMIVCGIFHNIHHAPSESAPDPDSKKNNLFASQNGYTVGSPFAYISLTDLCGMHSFNLRYVNLATEKVYFDFRLDIECKDPLQHIDVRVALPPLPMDIGVYALELLWKANEPLGAFRICVQESKREAKHDNDRD